MIIIKISNPETNQDIKPQEVLLSPVIASSLPQKSSENTYTDKDNEDGQVSLQPFCLQITEPGNAEPDVQISTSLLGDTSEETSEADFGL